MQLSSSNMYMIVYLVIFILFIVAFSSQPYLTIQNGDLNINFYYTTVIEKGYGGNRKIMYIKKESSNPFIILMVSIAIFIFFGCSFLTLFLNAKKLNKFFNILIFLSMVAIIVLLHVLIYDKTSDIKDSIDKELSGFTREKTDLKTTDTAGYAIMMTCTVLMLITIVSSFMFHK
jgi:hypothetical protein